MAEWLRHFLGLPCRRLVTDHEFRAITWNAGCGFIPEPQRYRSRCFLPRRCHDGPRRPPRSVTVAGNVTGVISTGDGSTVIQRGME
jgi:hypothetical protein